MSRFAQLVNAAQARKHADITPPLVDAHTAISMDAHLPETQDAHTAINMDAHTTIVEDAHRVILVDAPALDSHTPTKQKYGRPQMKTVDAYIKSVDALASTKNLSVDANAPTLKKSGRPLPTQASVHKSDRHRVDLIRQHFRIHLN